MHAHIHARTRAHIHASALSHTHTQAGDIVTDINGVHVSGKEPAFLRNLALGAVGTACSVVSFCKQASISTTTRSSIPEPPVPNCEIDPIPRLLSLGIHHDVGNRPYIAPATTTSFLYSA